MRTMGTLNRSVTDRMVAFIKDWLERNELRRSISRLDARDREKIIGESGLSNSDLAYVMRTPFLSDDLLSPMMRRFGLDPEELKSSQLGVVRDLERICTMCPNRRRCRQGVALGDEVETCRQYCPNSATLDAIATGTPAFGRLQ